MAEAAHRHKLSKCKEPNRGGKNQNPKKSMYYNILKLCQK